MSTISLSNMRLRILEAAGMENSSFVSTTELNSRINAAASALYDIIISTYESDYVISSVVSIGSTGIYDLSSLAAPGFYKLIGLDKDVGGQYIDVKRFNWNERNSKSNLSRNLNYGYELVKYRIVNNNLMVVPTESASGTYKIWYIPQLLEYSDTNTNIIFPNNYSDYILYTVVADILAKEESDNAYWVGKKNEELKRIKSSNNKDAANPQTMKRVRNRNRIFNEGN